jgi:hypothetical protein
VTVSRPGHKVKPNAKKRMNLRALAHPNAGHSGTRRGVRKPYATGTYGLRRAESRDCAEVIFPHKKGTYVTEITSSYALCTVAETR